MCFQSHSLLGSYPVNSVFPSPKSFGFWDQGSLLGVQLHLPTCHLSEADASCGSSLILYLCLLLRLSLSFLLSPCMLGSSAVFLPHHQPPLDSGLLDSSGSLLPALPSCSMAMEKWEAPSGPPSLSCALSPFLSPAEELDSSKNDMTFPRELPFPWH